MTEVRSFDWDTTPDQKDQTFSYLAKGMRALWHLVRTERKKLMLVVLFVAVIEIISLTTPFLFARVIDTMQQLGEETSSLDPTQLVATVGAMALLSVLTLVFQRGVQEPMFLSSLIRLENYWPRLAQEKLLALSVGFHERENTGRKIAKVNKGVEKLVGMVADIFWALLPSLFYLTFNLVFIFVYDWRLGLVFVLPLLPAVWVNLAMYRMAYPLWEEWEKKKEESIGKFCQSIINVRSVQSFVAEEREVDAHGFMRFAMERLDTRVSLSMQRYFFVMELLLKTSFYGTVITGLYFVSQGWSTIGVVTFIFITGNATIQSLSGIVQVYSRMLRHLVAAERMHQLLDEPVEVDNSAQGQVPTHWDGTLSFNEVSFTYQGKEMPILDSLSLSITPGEMLAFVGKSGSGKSTIVNLLARVYDPTKGSVCVGEHDARSVDRNWYRSKFAFVPQDVEIFDGTIRDNVAYAYPQVSDAVVTEALTAAYLTECIEDAGRFPSGILTEVGERGVRLSGGERQRVGIARAYVALLSGATVLVLDEATSSLDSQSEQVVQTFIEQLRKDKNITIIAIAHRLSTIKKADRICVLEQGRIIEMGDHEQLLKENGLYKRLVSLQQLGELRD